MPLVETERGICMEAIFGVIAAGCLLFGVYHILTLVLLWPRILAKYLLRNEKDVHKIRRTRKTLLCIQFLAFLASFLVGYFFWPGIFKYVLMSAGIGAGVVITFEVFIFHLLPIAFGGQIVRSPPKALLRETGDLWVRRITWIPALPTMFSIFIASHVLGMVVLMFSIVLSASLRKLTNKDEDRDRLDYHINRALKDTRNSEMKGLKAFLLQDFERIRQAARLRARILSIINLGYIGGQEALQALARLLHSRSYSVEQSYAAEMLGKMGDPQAMQSLSALLSNLSDEQSVPLGLRMLLVEKTSKALVGIAKDNSGLLISALRSDQSYIRTGTAMALANVKTKDPLVVEALISALTDEVQGVRHFALRALAKVAGERVRKRAGMDPVKWREWWHKKRKRYGESEVVIKREERPKFDEDHITGEDEKQLRLF